MTEVGIDAISFQTSHYYLNLNILAQRNGLAENKYLQSIGQEHMAIMAPDEDVVTLATEAARRALEGVDLTTIDTLFFATESGVDQSKSAGLFVHELLDLPNSMRVVELKQACYSATAAIRFALPFLQQHPEKKILLVAADNARYGIDTDGESSQGCGAVAMLLSANPRLLALDSEFYAHSESAMDFWRPNYRQEALVDGRASTKLYLTCLQKAWDGYRGESGRDYSDFGYFCFHVPVTRLAEKALKHLMKCSGVSSDFCDALSEQQVGRSLYYGRTVGNCYAGSLYLSIASLLENAPEDLTGKRIGFFSYGSGCVAEFFSGRVCEDYRKHLHKATHVQLLKDRQSVTYDEYLKFFQHAMPTDGSEYATPSHNPGLYRLKGIKDHKRLYQVVK